MHYNLKNETDFPKVRLLQVNSCGTERIIKTEYAICRPFGRNDFQFLYLKSGWLEVEIGDEKIVLNEGECAIFYPNVKQRYIFSKKGNPVTLWLHFTGDAATEAMSYINKKESSVFRISEKALFEGLFNRIIKVHNLKTASYISEENSILLQLINILSKESNRNRVTTRDEVLNAMEYLSSHMSENINLEEYVKQLNLSYSRFVHLFKENIGISPHQYLLKIRLERASYLLMYSTMNISDVAHSVGFGDCYYFSRIFKRKYLLSPREYRNKSF